MIACYVLLLGTFTAAYYLWPAWQIVTWSLIGLSSVLGIAVGTAIHQPASRRPWLLLALGNLSFTVGDAIYNAFTDVLGRQDPFPSLADAFYLVMYLLFAAGLFGFIRCRRAGRDRGSLLDALTLTAGLALLSWIYLIVPYARNLNLPLPDRAASIAYPLGDVLILAMLARLLAAGSTRARAVELLAAGTATLLVFDVLYGMAQLNSEWQTGSLLDLGWVFFYGACGLAALHPSMVRLTQPVARRQTEIDPGRIGLLAIVALIPPGVLLIEMIRGGVRDACAIAVFSCVLFLLVLARLSCVVSTHRQAVTRERALREAGASLLMAVSVEEVAIAVRVAAARLFEPGARHQVVLAVSEGDALRAVHVDPGDRPWRIRQVDEVSAAWLPVLVGRETRLVPTHALGGRVAAGLDGLDGLDGALLCPLALRDRPSGDPLIGVLIAAGDERQLAMLRDSLEMLAAQVALAVERVTLSQEINRRNSEAYFRTLVQNASDVIVILDDDDSIRYASPSAETMFGDVDLGGVLLTEFAHPRDSALVTQALQKMRSCHDQDRRGDWQVVRRDGACVEAEVRCSNLRHDPTVRGLVLTLRDVTEARKLEGELKHRAFHDSLTGLANRVLFQDRVEHALARTCRDSAVVGVLFIDLDDFKIVNDTRGHAVGDELLVAVARRLTSTLRAHDTAARLGGDEFAVLVDDAPTQADVETLAGQVVRVFSEPFQLSGGSVSVAASVGVATAMDSADADELLRHADLALYAAKDTGKWQWRRYQPVLQTGMLERHELRAGLDEAIAGAAFTLAYQPIVALAGGEVLGFEALLRWPHPTRGMILPDQFIALAEETAHIIPLGAWALDRAATDAARWQRDHPRAEPLHIGVNVSARQFRDPGFVDGVRRVLDTSGLVPSSLLLELTESLLMHRDEQVWTDMKTLKELGVRIAIDDFGTGYSSLSYLREFPIDVLKIDKSFIEGIAVSRQQVALVEAIVRIADTLELQVIAEGVESVVQRDLLTFIGCPLGQGYLFARPMPDKEAEGFLCRARTGAGPVAPEPVPPGTGSAGTGSPELVAPGTGERAVDG